MGVDLQKAGRKEKMKQRKKEYDTKGGLRGYCRICNRYYFFRNCVDTGSIQYHQHHSGVCQNCGYLCARIKDKESS